VVLFFSNKRNPFTVAVDLWDWNHISSAISGPKSSDDLLLQAQNSRNSKTSSSLTSLGSSLSLSLTLSTSQETE
jgi:hypothetical protein